jgi:hypothetical protein
MSRHWIMMSQEVLDVGMNDIAAALATLAKTHPKEAAALATVDWKLLRRELAEAALKQTAEALKLDLKKTYDNMAASGYHNERGGRVDGKPLRGESLGVLARGDIQLGFAYNPKDGSLETYYNGRSRDYAGGVEFEAWRKEFKKHLNKLCIEAALTVVFQGKVATKAVGKATVMVVPITKKVGEK